VTRRAFVLPVVGLALSAACVPLGRRAVPDREGPVVVVGVAPAGPGSERTARQEAENELRRRLSDEVERREALSRTRVLPASRARSQARVEAAAAALARELLVEIPCGDRSPSGNAILIGRVEGRAFENAVEDARAAGRRAPLRIVVVPLALTGDEADRRLYRFRELYSRELANALAENGIRSLDPMLLYRTLDDLGARAETVLSEDQVVLACRKLGADALVHGTARVQEAEVGLEVELRDGVSGRVLASIDGSPCSFEEAGRTARRHAVAFRSALGLVP